MRAVKKISAILLAAALLLTAGAAGVAGADVDYSDWSSTDIYPADVSGTVYFQAVKALMDIQAVSGYEDGLFHPERTISRAEFAAIVARSTNQQDLDSSASGKYFTDLGDAGWAEPYINRCYEQNWIKGVGDDRFAPESDVSYAEVMTILIRIRTKGNEPIGQWPWSIIEYANTYHMMGRVNITDWNAPAPRGDVAILTFQIIAPSGAQAVTRATFDNAAIAGVVGTPLTRTIAINLENDVFSRALGVGNDVTSWFRYLPGSNFTATIANIPLNREWIAIVITGTPETASISELNALIPGQALESGAALETARNPDARFYVVQ